MLSYKLLRAQALSFVYLGTVKLSLHVRRLKHGVPSTHPLTGTEIRALRKLKRLAGESPYVFLSERKGPLTDSSVRKMIAQAGKVAALGFPVHPHQLRHACGYKLANAHQDTRAIQLLPGASEHSTHGAIHGIRGGAVSGFLA